MRSAALGGRLLMKPYRPDQLKAVLEGLTPTARDAGTEAADAG